MHMDSKAWQNREEEDWYVHETRKKTDQKIVAEREDITKTVKQNRAAVDKLIMEERQNMLLQMERSHQEMDEKIKKERTAMDQMIKEERASMLRKFKQSNEEIDLKLQNDRKEMDRVVLLERSTMDFMTMQERADMDQKLEQLRMQMDHQIKLEQLRMEEKLMQHQAMINKKAEQEQRHIHSPEKSPPYSPPEVVMEFRIFQDGEYTQIPRGYFERPPGMMRFLEPLKVEWSEMQFHLCDHGYRYDSQVYYIMPGTVPPQGLVLISCEEHVRRMMEVLQGIKKCDLYFVRNYPSSDDTDDDMYRQDEYDPVSLDCDYRRHTDSDDDKDNGDGNKSA